MTAESSVAELLREHDNLSLELMLSLESAGALLDDSSSVRPIDSERCLFLVAGESGDFQVRLQRPGPRVKFARLHPVVLAFVNKVGIQFTEAFQVLQNLDLEACDETEICFMLLANVWRPQAQFATVLESLDCLAQPNSKMLADNICSLAGLQLRRVTWRTLRHLLWKTFGNFSGEEKLCLFSLLDKMAEQC